MKPSQTRCVARGDRQLIAQTKRGVVDAYVASRVGAGRVTYAGHLLCPFLAPGGPVSLMVVLFFLWRSAADHCCWTLGLVMTGS